MSTESSPISVRLSKDKEYAFSGWCLASVAAFDHDGRVRRQFAVYSNGSGYVAERIDSPGTIDVRFWGVICDDADAIYDFFGNEPLANYLYGSMRLHVPGLRVLKVT